MAEMDVQVKFTGDNKDAVKSIDEVAESLGFVEETADTASSSIEDTTDKSEKLGDAMGQAAGAADDTSKSLGDTQGAAEGAAGALGDTAAAAESLAGTAPGISGLASSFDSLEKSAKKLGRDFSTLVTAPVAALAALSLKNVFDAGAMVASSGAARQFALAVEGLLANFKQLAFEIGSQLAPAFTKLIGVGNTLIDSYRALSPGTKELLNNIALAAAAIGPALLAFSALSSIFIKLLPVIKFIGAALGSIAGFLTSPIALIGALVTTIAGLVNVFLKLRSAGVDTAKALQLAFNLFVTGFNNFVVGTLLSGVSLIIKAMSSLASSIAPGLKKGLDAAATQVDAWNSTLKQRFDATKGNIDSALEGVGSSAGDAFTFGLSTKLSEIGTSINDALNQAFQNVDTTGLNAAEKKAADEERQRRTQEESEAFLAELQKIQDRSNQIAETISGNLSNAFLDFADGTKTAADAFADFAKQTVRNLVSIATQAAIMNALFPPGSPMGNLIGSFAAATATRGFATGGYVSGPGTGTSDSIVARLSNGEFVNDAKTVSHFGADFFRNLKSMAHGGVPFTPRSSMPAFADGGMVTTSGVASPTVVIENNGTQKQIGQTSFDPATQVTTIVIDDINRNGPIAKTMQSTFGTRRGGFQ